MLWSAGCGEQDYKGSVQVTFQDKHAISTATLEAMDKHRLCYTFISVDLKVNDAKAAQTYLAPQIQVALALHPVTSPLIPLRAD